MTWRKGPVEKLIEGKEGLVRGTEIKVSFNKGQNNNKTSPITINCSS